MTPPLRFAIVGCGRIAQRHADHIARMAELAAVCDIDLSRAEQLSSEYGGAVFGCLEAMLETASDFDVISVCSPNGLHAEHSIRALDAGCHVVCEKPMAITSYDCGDMIQAAERANRRIFVVKQNRFNPPVAAVSQAISENRLGQIYSVQLNCYWNRNEAYYENRWKGTLELDGGCLYTQFSHFIDLLYWLVGDVDQAVAFTDNFAHRGNVEFEDTGVVALKFRNGALGSIHFTINSRNKNMEGSLTVFGSRGTVKIGGQYLNELEYQEIDGFTIDGLPPGRPANQYGTYVGSMSNHDLVYANVIDVLTNGGTITISAYEALKTVEIIEKIYESARWNLHDAQSPFETSSLARIPR